MYLCRMGWNRRWIFSLDEVNSSGGNGITDNAALARVLNRYKNDFGKSRVVVIKSQLGQPIAAFSGDNVYWEIPDDLPKMTKLMVDGEGIVHTPGELPDY